MWILGINEEPLESWKDCENKIYELSEGKLEMEKSNTGCEITVRHCTCPTNLAQRPIEKRFLLLNFSFMFLNHDGSTETELQRFYVLIPFFIK